MAMIPQPPKASEAGPNIADAFVADRQAFWSGFTSFATYAVIAIVLLLIGMWLFLV